MKEIKKLTVEQFRKMQLTELEMLEEFDSICRKHNIDYVLFGGSLLGAIRHKGYIPWDDDADIGMLREDYDAFKKVAHEMNPDICYFQDHDTDKEYRWGYGKLRRTNTIYVRIGQEHLKAKTGIFVDVFPMDDVPINTIGQIIQDIKLYCLRKILWSEVAKKNSKGIKKIWFTFLSKIPSKYIFKIYNKYAKRSKKTSKNRVRCLSFPATGTLYRKNPIKLRYSMPKEWFTDRVEYEFEGKKFYSSRDFDAVLSYIYGDYMKLPPEEMRKQHSPFSIIKFQDEV